MNTGDTAFMIVCAALVLLMTPALAFFYGGLVRRKNVVSTMMNVMAIIGIAILLWVSIGYTLVFGGNHMGIIGDFRWFFLNGIGMNDTAPYAETIPHLVFAEFQMMFAIITPALITGALVGRMKFKALCLFVTFWSIIVYYPLAHMVWGEGGWLAKIGSIDFAGGNVVHISSGISALTLAILLGRRKGYEKVSYRVHNIPFVVLGAGLLLFGWLGFNGGSALAANGLAAHAIMTSILSSAAAMVTWMIIDTMRDGKPTLVGASTGLVVGLVAITPGAGFVPVWAAFVMGVLVSPICYFGVILVKHKLKIDDSLDAFGCHGIGGLWGGIATGLFAQSSINPVARWNGLVFGEFKLFGAQLLGIVVTIAIAVVGTLLCYAVVKLIVKDIRVDDRSETIGLDLSEHGEKAYPAFNGWD